MSSKFTGEELSLGWVWLALKSKLFLAKLNAEVKYWKMNISESDWKIFRELRSRALQRFCDRILSEIAALSSDSSKSSHERFLAIYDLIYKQNKEMARAFDRLSRSMAPIHLHSIWALGLVKQDELNRFSPEIKKFLHFAEETFMT